MDFAIDIAGRHVPWTLLLLAVVALLWLVFVALSHFSRSSQPKSGLRSAERNLIICSVALLLAWGVAFDALSLVRSKSDDTDAAAAAAGASGSKGTCYVLTTAMTASQVTAKIGKADEVRNDEKTRGPGAETWIYRGTRCTVAMLDGKVESVN